MLREFELRDLDYFLTFFGDAEASQHVGGPSGREDTWRRMLAGAGLWHLTGIGMWAVAEKDGGPAIGHVGFFDFLRGCEPPIEGEAEMGWILAPQAHGKGYALEACEAILAWFDDHFGSAAHLGTDFARERSVDEAGDQAGLRSAKRRHLSRKAADDVATQRLIATSLRRRHLARRRECP